MQDYPLHQERGGGAKRDDIRQRVELEAERTFLADQPRDPAVEPVKNERAKNQPKRRHDRLRIEWNLRAHRRCHLDDVPEREEPAQQVAGGHQVRQEINPKPLLAAVVRLVGFWWVVAQNKIAAAYLMDRLAG